MSESWDRLVKQIEDLDRKVIALQREVVYPALSRKRDDEIERALSQSRRTWATFPILAFDASGSLPTAHHTTHENGGSDEISVLGLSGLLADAQTPLAHATSHQAGGADPIKLDDLATPDDNTDLNSSTARHGLLRKLSNVSTEYMDGTGAWSVPPGGAGGAPTTADYLVKTADAGLSAERVVTDGTSITADWSGAGLVTFKRAALTGDVTASADSNATTIANDAVTYAKIQNVSATDKLLGRATAGAGDVEEITCTAFARTILDDADAAAVRTTIGAGTGSGTVTNVSGTAPIASTGGATPAISLNDAGVTFAKIQDLAASTLIGRRSGAGTGVSEGVTIGSGLSMSAGGVLSATGAGVADGDYGDIVVSSSGAVWTIDVGVVTLAKMADINTQRIIGRGTAGTGVPESISLSAPFSITAGAFVLNTNATPITAIETVNTQRILGRGTAGSGSVEILTISSAFTISGGQFALVAGGVTIASLESISANRLLGRNSSSAGSPEQITLGTGVSISGAGVLEVSGVTPAAHATSHKLGGSDVILLNEFGNPTGSVNFNDQQATSFRVENRTSDPGSPTVGQLWLRTDL